MISVIWHLPALRMRLMMKPCVSFALLMLRRQGSCMAQGRPFLLLKGVFEQLFSAYKCLGVSPPSTFLCQPWYLCMYSMLSLSLSLSSGVYYASSHTSLAHQIIIFTAKSTQVLPVLCLDFAKLAQASLVCEWYCRCMNTLHYCILISAQCSTTKWGQFLGMVYEAVAWCKLMQPLFPFWKEHCTEKTGQMSSHSDKMHNMKLCLMIAASPLWGCFS